MARGPQFEKRWCKGINDSGSKKKKLGDGGSILGRGVVSFFSPARRWPQEISFETDSQDLCDWRD